MDLYDENEHVISSDEYTDDDNEDDALMDGAVRAQNDIRERPKDFNYQTKSKFESNQKQKQLSSLIRKNKISIIYKNKSIRWLNSKKQRERYKELIYQNKDKNVLVNTKDPQGTLNLNSDPILIQSAVSNADSNNESVTNIQIMKKCQVELHGIAEAKENTQILDETIYGFKKKHLISEKRDRSLTPKLLNESTELKIEQNEKKSIRSPQFYKSLNDMFATFDNIATDHINTITENTLTSVEEKMVSLKNEINALSEILNTKEKEWNRLLHLKTVKEEIYSRLNQKRQNLIIQNNSKMETNKHLDELRELEFDFPTKKTVSPGVSFSTMTIQKLIENRANMNSEDLEREKNNTSRLHSLLVSSNMLHGKELSECFSPIRNGKRKNSFIASSSNAFDKEPIVTKRARRGEFRDVKSIFADVKKKNQEILPLTGKGINLSNCEVEKHKIGIPVHDNKLSSTQYLHLRRHSDLATHGDSLEEVSVSPKGSLKKLRYRHDTNAISAVNNHFNIGSKDNYFQYRDKADFDEKLTKNFRYPLCQECKTTESRFVCAGCSNQWYCSKKCQVSAWDKHSDLCTE